VYKDASPVLRFLHHPIFQTSKQTNASFRQKPPTQLKMQSIIIASAVEEKKTPGSFSNDGGCKEPFCLWLTGVGVVMSAAEEKNIPVSFSNDGGCKEPFCLWLTGVGVVM
jgi:hypothetical protein